VLSFEGFTFGGGLAARDTAFDVVDGAAPGVFTVGVGRIPGFSGTLAVGTLRFTAVAAGPAGLQLTDSLQWSGLSSPQGDAIAFDATTPDLFVSAGDADGDGIPDELDPDDDNDRVPDAEDPDPLDRMNPIPIQVLPSRGGWRVILEQP
jgi:hypothetical protein